MSKYVCISLIVSFMLKGMEPEIPQLEWTKKDYTNNTTPTDIAYFHSLNTYPFAHLTVLDADGNRKKAEFIATRARLVHSNNYEYSRTKHTEVAQRSSCENLFFVKPQKNTYDCISIARPHLLTRENLQDSFAKNYQLLKKSGELFVILKTQTDGPSIAETIMEMLYPDICALLPKEKQKIADPMPALITIDTKKKHPSGRRVQKVLKKTNFDIISWQTKKYEIIIKDRSKYQQFLKDMFSKAIAKHEISFEAIQPLQEQFAFLVIEQLKQNSDGCLVHPVNVTELHLRKVIPEYKYTTPF